MIDRSRTVLFLELWCCEDPKLMVYKPNKPAETLWEGTFHNSPSVEEMEQLRSEVRTKAQELNVKLSDGLSGWKYEEDVKE